LPFPHLTFCTPKVDFHARAEHAMKRFGHFSSDKDTMSKVSTFAFRALTFLLTFLSSYLRTGLFPRTYLPFFFPSCVPT
jgi:hypothetical protein